MRNTFFMLLILVGIASAQINTWVKATGSLPGGWTFPAMTYAPTTNEFILSMGHHGGLYTVTVFKSQWNQWINALPNDTLYGSAAVSDSIEALNGKWADSTGLAYGFGRGQGNGVFGWGFQFANVKGYLRPNPNPDNASATLAYSQFC
ncbi:MAG: hypothetical protein JNL74_22605 [Fibrobacteres bacterium]|nr:hypothetical protein [Fibrobacterota bacterium]